MTPPHLPTPDDLLEGAKREAAQLRQDIVGVFGVGDDAAFQMFGPSPTPRTRRMAELVSERLGAGDLPGVLTVFLSSNGYHRYWIEATLKPSP